MLAVLDPLLFSDEPIRRTELEEIVQTLRQTGARIPDPVAPPYWKKLQRELIRPLSQDHELRTGLDALRSFASPIEFPPAPPRVPVWDFHTMFDPAGPEWLDVMTRTVTGCVLTGEESLLVTRLLVGRNAEEHQGPGNCRLTEKTCWNLRLKVPDKEIERIPAICRRRNVAVPWTTRFDDRLPAESDGAAFPFCHPEDWFKTDVRAFETHQSRPAWLDAKGSYWACPATGWGYHWDVYLAPDLVEQYGLDQLNVVRWGVPPAEGAIGSLHHVPREKRSRLRKETGWDC